ncbi:MAG: hypothetical protein GX907_02515 [Clostridiaceae bacterium]|nr:hypothetical protein [Clostridiaceae bacterium]
MKNKLSVIGKRLGCGFRNLWADRSGGATLEVAVVTAVLVAIALIFNQQIREYAKSIFEQVFNVTPNLNPGTP